MNVGRERHNAIDAATDVSKLNAGPPVELDIVLRCDSRCGDRVVTDTRHQAGQARAIRAATVKDIAHGQAPQRRLPIGREMRSLSSEYSYTSNELPIPLDFLFHFCLKIGMLLEDLVEDLRANLGRDRTNGLQIFGIFVLAAMVLENRYQTLEERKAMKADSDHMLR
jgi:hypothetical protein